MKRLFLTMLLFQFALSIVSCALAQNPLVRVWDYRFGGTDDEWLLSFEQTTDGGYILGGHSLSNMSGDKSQNLWGSFDYWIVKIDSLGNKLWDKDFGGTGSDILNSIQQTKDGGYILGGYSESNIGGDKTQNSWGGVDYWIVKTDTLGNKLWDKNFGGTDDDWLHYVSQTTDGGYILGGDSRSNISGDKTQNSWGGSDYWIIKTDSMGNMQWNKDFGGTDNEPLLAIQQTGDGGFILAGFSFSNISGDKTQNSWGGSDYWMVKTDSLGNKLWDKDFGGTDEDKLWSIQQTSDHGFILGGWSWSNISGDKTQNVWGENDYWILKTDSLGNKLWDKNFGGIDDDYFCSIQQTADSGYILNGISFSNISGDKTEVNLGWGQMWLLKTDFLGSKQWDKTIFTTAFDDQALAIQTKDGCYSFANHTGAGIGGYKTQPSWNNSSDYWIIKFCDTTLATGNSAEPAMNVGMVVFPNPVEAELKINNEELKIGTPFEISVYNMVGVLAVELPTANCLLPTCSIDVSGLIPGMYLIELKSGDKIYRSKFIKSSIQ